MTDIETLKQELEPVSSVIGVRRGRAPVDTPGLLTPPLKWAGGKRWLIPWLQEIFTPFSGARLVEPFVGGMAVALGLNPKRALLNDSNPHLINFYRQIQQGITFKLRMKNEREFFLRKRARFNSLVNREASDSEEAAALFYYLNRTGFNGLCRFNSKGEFNVPFGRYSTINYLKDFSNYVPTMTNWRFRCGDFATLPIRESDFLYVDPPYDVPFTKYSKEDFSWSDQLRLVEWMVELKCPIVASNQATPRIVSLYRKAGFQIAEVDAPRRISCTGSRIPAREILAFRGISPDKANLLQPPNSRPIR